MPVGGALFGSSTAGPGSTGGNKHLLEVRAGKMSQKGRMVYPDKRKGLLYVYQSDDSLMHFCWQDRTSGIVEDDLIIFPDDCEYVRVSQCTTGRVFLLKFKSSNRRFFFWLQEPRTDKDEENCRRINEILNNPSGSVPNSGSSDQDLQSLLNNMSQSQLMQLFGGGVGQIGGLSSLLGTMNRSSSGGANRNSSTPAIAHRPIPSTPSLTPAQASPITSQTATPAVPADKGKNGSGTRAAPASGEGAAAATAAGTAAGLLAPNPIQLADLQNFLQVIQAPNQAQQQSVDLSTALTGETLSSLLSNTASVQQLQSHLPPVRGGTTEEQLRSTLASPQFQQAVHQFSSALESGQLGPIVSQFAVNAEAVAAAAQGNMAGFVQALEKQPDEKEAAAAGTTPTNKKEKGAGVEKDKEEEKKKKKEEGDDDAGDEGMQLD